VHYKPNSITTPHFEKRLLFSLDIFELQSTRNCIFPAYKITKNRFEYWSQVYSWFLVLKVWKNYPDIGILIDFYFVHRDFSKCLLFLKRGNVLAFVWSNKIQPNFKIRLTKIIPRWLKQVGKKVQSFFRGLMDLGIWVFEPWFISDFKCINVCFILVFVLDGGALDTKWAVLEKPVLDGSTHVVKEHLVRNVQVHILDIMTTELLFQCSHNNDKKISSWHWRVRCGLHSSFVV
jgi:hypothetical protein